MGKNRREKKKGKETARLGKGTERNGTERKVSEMNGME